MVAEASGAAASDGVWAAALEEVESQQRQPGLWARCFAEAGGDEGKAKAAYIRERVSQQAPVAAPAAPALGYCPNCGKQCAMDAETCPHCAAVFGPWAWKPQHSPPHSASPVSAPAPARSSQQAGPMYVQTAKSRGVYVILGLFFGLMGVHNFYAGRFGVGVAQLLTVLILGWFVVGLVIVAFWVLIELFIVTEDGKGQAFA